MTLTALRRVSATLLIALSLFVAPYAESTILIPVQKYCEDSLRKDPLPTYKTTGHFTLIPMEKQLAVAQQFMQEGAVKPLTVLVEPGDAKDYAYNFQTATPDMIRRTRNGGLSNAIELHVSTSVAGLATRLGGDIAKALVPMNIIELMTPEEWNVMLDADEILNVEGDPTPLVLKKYPDLFVNVSADATSEIVRTKVAELRAYRTKIMNRVMSDPNGINYLDMKQGIIALESILGRGYISFDAWTSEGNHNKIRDYFTGFKTAFGTKNYHEEPVVEQVVTNALSEWISASEALRETHVFGWQESYYAINRADGVLRLDAPVLGAGAGNAKPYMDKSGRTEELRRLGKKWMVFENTEIVNDYALIFGAHLRAQETRIKHGFQPRPFGFVMVPIQKGYKGGVRVKMNVGGEDRHVLFEMSQIPKGVIDMATDFNTNTTIESLDLVYGEKIGFEDKKKDQNNQPTLARVKFNKGDATQDFASEVYLGRIPNEYENGKSLKEMGESGARLLAADRDLLKTLTADLLKTYGRSRNK